MPLTDLEGRPLPPAPRTPVCRATGAARVPACGRRRLVPLLPRQRAQARRLLRGAPEADQRRQVAEGLLLRRPEGVLRHVLPELGPVLTACLLAAALAAGLTGAWSPCGFSMVETLAPHGYARRLRTSVAASAHVRARRARRRRGHVRRPRRRGRPLGAGGAGRGRRGRRRRGRRRGRRGARPADRAADPPPGAGGMASGAAGAARRGRLRRAARPRLHDVRALVRGLGARGREHRARRPGARARRWASPSAPAARCR